MWASVLPLDVGKTRLQAAFPGDKYDVGMLRQLKMVIKIILNKLIDKNSCGEKASG